MRKMFFDTETYPISKGRNIPELVCFTAAIDDDRDVFTYRKEKAIEQWKRMIVNPKILFIAHNAAFDMAVMARAADCVEETLQAYQDNRVYCTQLATDLCNLAFRGQGIQEGANALLRSCSTYNVNTQGLSKLKKGGGSWRLHYNCLKDIPLDKWPKDALEYAKLDVTVLRDLYKHLQHFAGEHSYLKDDMVVNLPEQVKAGFALQLMASYGLRVREEETFKLQEEYRIKKENAKATMWESGLLRENGTKDKKTLVKMVEDHYTALGVPAPETEKGNVKTDKEVLEQIDTPEIAAYRTFTQSGWYETLLETLKAGIKNTICTNYRTLVSTGRTASKSPNVQNMPRKGGIRECFNPRPGWTYIYIDYDSAELRGLAQVIYSLNNGKSVLAKRYREDPNFDPHTYFASMMLDINYKEGMKRKKEKDEDLLTKRQYAKIANFGFSGGMGVDALITHAKTGYNTIITPADAQMLKDGFFDTWSGVSWYLREYISNHESMNSQGHRTMEQLFSGRIRSGCTYCNAANTMFQGLIADGTKNALWECCKAFYTGKVDAAPISFIHDEILFEVPKSKAEATAPILVDIMVESLAKFLPDIPVTAEATISDRWSK